MHHVTARTTIAVAAAALVLLGSLTACAPAKSKVSATAKAHISTSHPVHPPHATPIPTPTGPAALPADVLLRITATVTAPGGAAADLVQTVFEPAPLTTAQETQLSADCQAGFGDTEPIWGSGYPGALGLTSTITATLHAGSPAWDNTNNSVLVNFIAAGDFTGAYATWEAECAPGFITIPGTQQALAPIQATDPSGQLYGWAGEFASYGFLGGANDPGDPDFGGDALISNCHIQLSPTAAANSVAAGWAAQTMTVADACGYSGPQAP